MTFLCQIYRTKRRRDLPVILNIIYARSYKDSGCLRARALSLSLRTTASVFSIQVRRVVHGARDKPRGRVQQPPAYEHKERPIEKQYRSIVSPVQ